MSIPLPAVRPEGLEHAMREARINHQGAESFARLQAQLSPRLFRYFRAHAFSPEDAEDLVQGVLARIWQGLPGLRHEERFLAWVFSIARNVRRAARVEQARERRWRAADSQGSEDLPDPRVEGQIRDQRRAELVDALNAAVDALPTQQRQCLLLRVRDERSYEEIASSLQLSLYTVRNHLSAAKKNLRRRLGVELDVATVDGG
jgi:RNA polymerase sigma-70 factor (ECF subfamily)